MNVPTFLSLIWLGLLESIRDIRYAIRFYRRATFYLAVFLALFVMISIEVNWSRTRYTIVASKNAGHTTYKHSVDERTTNILNYLTGQGPFPESERFRVYRQYVKNRLEDEKIAVPENFFSLDPSGVNSLAIKWYKKRFPKYPKDKETLQRLIDMLFENAVRPPLEGFTPNVNDNLWHLLERVGSPKVRWIEEQDEPASRLVVYSGGNGFSFYDPTDNTIYIRYANSVNNLLDEVGHADQFHRSPLWSYVRMSKSMLTAWIGGEFDMPTALEVYKLRYLNVKTFEGEAHGPIKDRLLKESGLLAVDEKVLKKT